MGKNQFTCNICHMNVDVGADPLGMTSHMELLHKDVCDLHKSNPAASVGFRIEFLQLDQTAVSLSEGGDVTLAAAVEEGSLLEDHSDYTKPVTVAPRKVKPEKQRESESRRRSWVWKYFDKLSSIIFKCNICNVVLSIKGCNTNNMNRHVKSKHPALYHAEMENTLKKKVVQEPLTDVGCEVEIPGGKDEPVMIRQIDEYEKLNPRSRTSWVWNYFAALSRTHAQCKLCRRSINHGGNATGNMNRHLKKLHEDVYRASPLGQPQGESVVDVAWVWKLFASDDPKFYECRLCGFQCAKFPEGARSVAVVLEHLRDQHEVVSGDQIVTAAECEQELAECSVAVDFLKDAEEM